MNNEQINRPSEHAAGMPLPPAVSRRGGQSGRESTDTSLVPPFKGKSAFQPVIVRTRVDIVERSLSAVPVAEPPDLTDEEATEPLEVEALLPAVEPEVQELPLEVAEATELESAFDMQDLFVADADQVEFIDADELVTEFTLSPEFEEATVLNGAADAAGNGHDSALQDVDILEVGAFIEPPPVEESDAADDLDTAASLAALAAQHDALEFEPLVIAKQDPAQAAPTAELPDQPPEPAVEEPAELAQPQIGQAVELPEAAILQAVQTSGLAHHDLADRLQRLSQRLRTEAPEELLPSLARGDRFEVLIAGLLAGFLAARND